MNKVTWTVLSCFMTSGLNKILYVKYDHTLFLCLQIAGSGIRPHVNWSFSLVIADGHLNFPQMFVWVHVCMG